MVHLFALYLFVGTLNFIPRFTAIKFLNLYKGKTSNTPILAAIFAVIFKSSQDNYSIFIVLIDIIKML